MPKNRVLHASITDDTHEKLTRVCSEIGCSITDYVTSVLDKSFEDSIWAYNHQCQDLKK
jgi:antitoxin component of RelBE/YafQ-DinJ toxin-antitoxin module